MMQPTCDVDERAICECEYEVIERELLAGGISPRGDLLNQEQVVLIKNLFDHLCFAGQNYIGQG